ncbi:MAG: hypothetical protein ABW360_09790 [Phenylobacterium sp.]
MTDIHTLRISFDGALQPGPKPWMWATVEVVLDGDGATRPTVSAQVPVPFEGQGVFEMRELAWTAFREALEGALAAGAGKTAQQLSFTGA